MSDTPNLKNIKNIVGDGGQYLITGNDDVLNVDTTADGIRLVLPNIQNSKLQQFYKSIYVNDTGNNASVNIIRISTLGGDTINGSPFVDIDVNGGSVVIELTGLKTWVANFGTTSSPIVADEKVKVSGSDALAEFLKNKLVAGSGINLNILSVLGVEQIQIEATGGGGGNDVIIGNTLFVAENGDDLLATPNNWAKPYRSVYAASLAADTNDTIYVFAGTYNETNSWCLDRRKYYLELGARVVTTGVPAMSDGGTNDTYQIYGQGVIQSDVNVIDISSPLTVLYLQCQQLRSTGTGIANISGSFYLDCQIIAVTSGYGFFFNGATCNGTLLFNRFDALGFETAIFTAYTAGNVIVKGQLFQSNLSGRFPIIGLSHQAGATFQYEVDRNDLTATVGGEIVHNSNGSTVFKNCFFWREGTIISASNGFITILNCNFLNQDVNNAAINVLSDPSGSAELILKGCYVESFNSCALIGNDAKLSIIDSQLFSSNSGGSAVLFLSAGGSQKLYLTNVTMYGSGTGSSIGSLTPNNIFVLTSCAANQATDATLTNQIAGTNIVVDPNVFMLKQILL